MTVYEILILVGVPSIIVLVVQWLCNFLAKKHKSKTNDNELLKTSIQALLRHELLKDGNKYIEQGWCPIAEKEDYENMYQQYHKLGKNGVMDDMHEKVIDLPTMKHEE